MTQIGLRRGYTGYQRIFVIEGERRYQNATCREWLDAGGDENAPLWSEILFDTSGGVLPFGEVPEDWAGWVE